MNKPGQQNGKPSSTETDSERNILKLGVFRDLYFHVLKGISMYAVRARRLGAKNEIVDKFIALSLSHFISNNSIDIKKLKVLLDDAIETRKIAKAHYIRACKKSRKKPERLGGPAAIALFSSESAIRAQAQGLSVQKAAGNDLRQLAYWEGICIERLATMGAVVISAPTTNLEKYDICEFLHYHLDTLVEKLSTFELMALADDLEKAQLKVVNALIAGDTIVNTPTAPSGIKRSLI